MIKRFKKGLTLIELVVTIAVVAILTGAAVGTYFGVTESSKHSRAETEALTFFNEVQNSVVVSKEYNQYKVSLSTKDGLIFSRYSPETIEDFVEQVSAVEHRYNAVIGSTVQAIKQVEPQEKPTVYFFNTYYRNDGDVAEVEYFGYVPSGFAGSYVKVVDFKTGTIVNEPSFTTVPYHTPAPWVEPQPEPEPTIPTGTKIIKSLYLYAPSFDEGKVGVTQFYKTGDEISHYESRNYDYVIDYVGESTYRFRFTYICGYDNYVQFGLLNNSGNVVSTTREILVEDSHINASMRYMHVPGIYDWQTFNIEDYSNVFNYYLHGIISGEDVLVNKGKYGLAKKDSSESNPEYRIEEVYLKEGDKVFFTNKTNDTTYGYDEVDTDDKNCVDKDGNYIVIKPGYSGSYSFYLQPLRGEAIRIWIEARLDKELKFKDGFITTSAETEIGYAISSPMRLIDSSEKFGDSESNKNKTIKFKLRLSATSSYSQKQNYITGDLKIKITNPDGHIDLSAFKTKITTTKQHYYNVKLNNNDVHAKNTLDYETIGHNITKNGSEFSQNITVMSNTLNVNAFEHIIEINHPSYSSKEIKIHVSWGSETAQDFAFLAFESEGKTLDTIREDYRLNKNIFFTKEDAIIATQGQKHWSNIDGQRPDYMYMIENVSFTETTNVKIRRTPLDRNDNWVQPSNLFFNNDGTPKGCKVTNNNDFILEAGKSYKIYCFAKLYEDNGVTQLAFVCSECYEM